MIFKLVCVCLGFGVVIYRSYRVDKEFCILERRHTQESEVTVGEWDGPLRYGSQRSEVGDMKAVPTPVRVAEI